MVVDAKVVKILRQKTGAGIMDCKEALTIAEGDMDSAVEVLRKKGIAKAEKKVGRKADQGSVVAYIHPGNRVGVLVEINCETDFVAKTDSFHIFAKDVAMQVAAANPLTVSREQIDNVIIDKERNIYLEQAKALGKPENLAIARACTSKRQSLGLSNRNEALVQDAKRRQNDDEQSQSQSKHYPCGIPEPGPVEELDVI